MIYFKYLLAFILVFLHQIFFFSDDGLCLSFCVFELPIEHSDLCYLTGTIFFCLRTV
jgi:hypothetical protein